MSQQKMLFAVCLVAGLVALASGQSMDTSKCADQARNEFRQLVRSVTTHLSEFSNDVTEHASSSFDIQGFQNEVRQLSQQFASYADMSQAMSVERYMNTSYKIAQSYASMIRYFMSSRAGLAMMSSYTDFAMKMLNAQSTFGMNVARGCMPNTGSN